MFYAVIKDKHLTFNKDAILVFETVIVNEGEHYDPYDGVFVKLITTRLRPLTCCIENPMQCLFSVFYILS